MKPVATALAIAAACSLCAILPFAAGAGIGALTGGAGFAAALVIIAGAGLAFAMRRAKTGTVSCATATEGQSCGCGSVSTLIGAKSPAAAGEEPAIACTLGASDFKERAAWIRGIAARHLRASSRTPLSLSLTYAPEAREDVRELVAKEQACCGFLQFDLREGAGSVQLTVTAPEQAREAADLLFDHFAPDAARPA